MMGIDLMKFHLPNKTQTFAALAAGGALHMIVSKLLVEPSTLPTIVGLHLAGIAALLYALVGLIKLVRDLL
jgi:hypothetical protein